MAGWMLMGVLHPVAPEGGEFATGRGHPDPEPPQSGGGGASRLSGNTHRGQGQHPLTLCPTLVNKISVAVHPH